MRCCAARRRWQKKAAATDVTSRSGVNTCYSMFLWWDPAPSTLWKDQSLTTLAIDAGGLRGNNYAGRRGEDFD